MNIVTFGYGISSQGGGPIVTAGYGKILPAVAAIYQDCIEFIMRITRTFSISVER